MWPCPELYLPEPSMQTLPPREPHPTLHFSNKTKPLPTVLLADSANISSTATAHIARLTFHTGVVRPTSASAARVIHTR